MLVLLAVGVAQPAVAQLVGPEFQVNSFTTGDQDYPAVASDAAGNFVVVWKGDSQDGSGFGIFGQRFDSVGARAGSEFQVNTYTPLDQDSPDVAADEAGNFLVVWKRVAPESADSNLFAQRFDAAGQPAGGEFQVNSSTTGEAAVLPAVAADGLGNFVVVWQDDEVIARRFDADGAPLGGEFQVNSATFDAQGRPAVASSAASAASSASTAGTPGSFVVVWDSYGQDGSNYGIFGQRFDSAGTPVGGEFQVNTYTSNWQVAPAAAMGPLGDFVVVWNRARSTGGQGSEIVGQRFDATGSPVGSEFSVSTSAPGYKWNPAVAVDAAGSFVVTWGDPGQDGSSHGVFARRFDASGSAVAGEFQVNTYTSSAQFAPVIAAGTGEKFVAVWISDPGQDGLEAGVFAQRLAPVPFSDGFESGDTCPWSTTVGGGDFCP